MNCRYPWNFTSKHWFKILLHAAKALAVLAFRGTSPGHGGAVKDRRPVSLLPWWIALKNPTWKRRDAQVTCGVLHFCFGGKVSYLLEKEPDIQISSVELDKIKWVEEARHGHSQAKVSSQKKGVGPACHQGVTSPSATFQLVRIPWWHKRLLMSEGSNSWCFGCIFLFLILFFSHLFRWHGDWRVSRFSLFPEVVEGKSIGGL